MLDDLKIADEVMRKLEIVEKDFADIVYDLIDTEIFLRTNSHSERFNSLYGDFDYTKNVIKTLSDHITQLISFCKQTSISKNGGLK